MANLFMNSLFADPDEEGLTKALIAVLLWFCPPFLRW